jgi:hypothetical protein
MSFLFISHKVEKEIFKSGVDSVNNAPHVCLSKHATTPKIVEKVKDLNLLLMQD